MTELEEISKATTPLYFQTPFVNKLQALKVIQCISLLQNLIKSLKSVEGILIIQWAINPIISSVILIAFSLIWVTKDQEKMLSKTTISVSLQQIA